MLEHISSTEESVSDALLRDLDRDGVVMLPQLVSAEQLKSMQVTFATRLRRLRWNDLDGYEQTEVYRHMVHDVLILDQGFVDIGLHPIIKRVLDGYLSSNYELTEAKGWKSLPTRRDFHGWHGDAWYEQAGTSQIHCEVKLAMYLTDVRSGAFNYIKGSHRKQHPRMVHNDEVKNVSQSTIAELIGPAGTAFLFDTSGIHRQGVPMLDERHAVFYNYHDPSVRLQQEDIGYYRYHPLLLNAAFLGGLTPQDQRILGFGNKTNYIHSFVRKDKHSLIQKLTHGLFITKLYLLDLPDRLKDPIRRRLRP